ncbi:MAG: hypothetical protein O7F16_01705, partial [Acidobacteria bacterium]|nr:hypothetical protein [Acidobacteriota bacterium]
STSTYCWWCSRPEFKMRCRLPGGRAASGVREHGRGIYWIPIAGTLRQLACLDTTGPRVPCERAPESP